MAELAPSGLVQDRTRKEYEPDQHKFERLHQHTKNLYEALEHRMYNDQP